MRPTLSKSRDGALTSNTRTMAPSLSIFAVAAGTSLLINSTAGAATGTEMSSPLQVDADAPTHASHYAVVWTPESMTLAGVLPRHADENTYMSRDPLVIPLQNDADIAYSGKISLGTPPQVFNMYFDTTASDTWVSNISSHAMFRYNHDASSTYHANETAFESFVKGIVSQDVLRIGGATLPGQYFVETSTYLLMAEITGVFGLGFDSESVVPMETPLHHLAREKLIDRAMFGFYCGRDQANGELTLGDINPNRFSGELHFANVISKSQWLVQLTSIKAGNVTLDADAKLLMATTSSFVSGPEDAVAQIAKTVGATKPDFFYKISCTASPKDIMFTIADREFVLTKDEYILPSGDPDMCDFAFQDGDATWTLGTAFFRKYYAAFDMDAPVPRIGFAPALH